MTDNQISSNASYIDASTLNDLLKSEGEFALLDVREATAFSNGHLWLANALPYSRLELKVRRFVPRTSTQIILCDQDDGLAEQAARVLGQMGYSNTKLLMGGIRAWKDAGYDLVDGNYVIAHSLGYFIEDYYATPVISARELQSRLKNNEPMMIVDCRAEPEHQHASLPGSISIPAAEVIHRIPDLVEDDNTPIVVHCAGITRAALGGQSLLNCGIKNPVYSLIDGTRGWDLADGDLISDQPIDQAIPSAKAKAFALAAANKLAEQYQLEYLSNDQMQSWRQQNPHRTVYNIDVRSEQEYLQAHFPGSLWIPGGELIGMTIDHLATQNARLCLFADQDCARAEITASWMKQQGWRDVVLASDWREEIPLQSGPEPDYYPELDQLDAHLISPQQCAELLSSNDTLLLDFSTSRAYRQSHVPTATWASRAQLFQLVEALKNNTNIICTSDDETVARLASKDIKQLTGHSANVLQDGNQAWATTGFELETGMGQRLGEIDDVDKFAPPTSSERDVITEWHWKSIRWRHGLYQQFKLDQPIKFIPDI